MNAWRLWVLLLFFFLPVTVLSAAEIQPAGTPLRKLQRGFLNAVLSPVEISYEMHNVRRVNNFIPSWASGFTKGVAYMGGRIMAGAYEMVTFPIPAPAGYEPVLQPEFEWEHFDKPKA